MDNRLILNLISFFIVYSFFGWILESVYKSILKKNFVNSGFLHGPFCPIYGVGAIIMYVFLDEFKANSIILFFTGFVVLSVWEYFVGWLLEKTFNTKYWDYSESKFNIKGRVCLLNSIFWGILGIVFIEIISPFIESKLLLIDFNILIYLNILIYAYLVIDVIVSTIKVRNIEIRLRSIEEIGEKLKEKLLKLEELKEHVDHKKIQDIKQDNLELLQKMIEELKESQEKLNKKLYKHVNRLKKAFPTIKSESINKILNNKIEEIKNRQKEK